MKKPFKDTKIGKFFKEKFPDILDVAGDLTGIEGLNVISNLIKGKTLSKEDEIEFLKLKNEYEIEIYKLDIEALRIEFEDLKSARDREARIVEATGKPDYAQWVVGLIGLFISGTVIWVGLFGKINDRELFFHLMGLVEGSILLAIFGYYFGSSLGSKKKDDLLRK
jgi:hypothetical protein